MSEKNDDNCRQDVREGTKMEHHGVFANDADNGQGILNEFPRTSTPIQLSSEDDASIRGGDSASERNQEVESGGEPADGIRFQFEISIGNEKIKCEGTNSIMMDAAKDRLEEFFSKLQKELANDAENGQEISNEIPRTLYPVQLSREVVASIGGGDSEKNEEIESEVKPADEVKFRFNIFRGNEIILAVEGENYLMMLDAKDHLENYFSKLQRERS